MQTTHTPTKLTTHLTELQSSQIQKGAKQGDKGKPYSNVSSALTELQAELRMSLQEKK